MLNSFLFLRRFIAGLLVKLLAGEGLAGNVGVPIHERAIGIFLPCPHMKRVERWESEAIWAFEIVKELYHELRRLSLMSLIPGARSTQVVRSATLHGAAS